MYVMEEVILLSISLYIMCNATCISWTIVYIKTPDLNYYFKCKTTKRTMSWKQNNQIQTRYNTELHELIIIPDIKIPAEVQDPEDNSWSLSNPFTIFPKVLFFTLKIIRGSRISRIRD